MNIAGYIDHTILKPTTLVSEVAQLCKEAVEHSFAAVCVPPMFVKHAKEFTAGSDVKVATVIGFPFGYHAIEAKVAETALAIVDGADELDMVINIAALKNNDWQYLVKEIQTIMPLIQQKSRVLKVIIESGVLTDEEIIRCCEIYGLAGVHYMKTSTGYAEKGATTEAVRLMRAHLPEQIKIKASGGIRTFAFAKELIDAGANRIGCSGSVKIMQEAAQASGL